MKFIFKSKFQGFGSPETTMEFEADDLNDVLMYFTDFLRGAGYTFDGVVDIVSLETHSEFDEEQQTQNGVWPFNKDEHEYEKEELPFPNYGGERCLVCGITRQEMGQNICYDARCGLGLNRV